MCGGGWALVKQTDYHKSEECCCNGGGGSIRGLEASGSPREEASPQLQGDAGGGQEGLPGDEVVCSREQKKGHVQEPRDDTCSSKILGFLYSTGINSFVSPKIPVLEP